MPWFRLRVAEGSEDTVADQISYNIKEHYKENKFGMPKVKRSVPVGEKSVFVKADDLVSLENVINTGLSKGQVQSVAGFSYYQASKEGGLAPRSKGGKLTGKAHKLYHWDERASKGGAAAVRSRKIKGSKAKAIIEGIYVGDTVDIEGAESRVLKGKTGMVIGKNDRKEELTIKLDEGPVVSVDASDVRSG